MKKIILTLFLVSIFFIASCTTPQQPQPDAGNVNLECIKQDDKCCKGDSCSAAIVDCIQGYIQEFKNCDQDCKAVVECVPEKTSQTGETVKEFTVEADDLGLYPETLTLNKGDQVKITFKVRQDKVYYGGLDFRSDVWSDTGKVLPRSNKNS